jgi:hypothetical protein
MYVVVSGFFVLGFVSNDDPAFDAYRNLSSDLTRFDSRVDASANVNLSLTNVFDPISALTQFATLAVGLFNIFINAIAIIFTLPLTTLSVVNAFPLLPSEFKLIIGSFAVIIEAFGAIFFLTTIIAVLRGGR